MCGYCGAPLVAGSPPPGIRRTVTIAISDLKGSTALGEKLDPESLFGILALYFDAMRLIFESHGGTIEKIIGDAIVAVFGLTATGEDDARGEGVGLAASIASCEFRSQRPGAQP